MKKILLYQNRKIPPIAWDASDSDKMRDAFYSLFRMLHDDWGVYSDLEPPDHTTGVQFRYYQDAIRGDKDSAMRLLAKRRNYDYQHWDLIDIQEPI